LPVPICVDPSNHLYVNELPPVALIESWKPPLTAVACGVPGFTAGQLDGFTVTETLLLSAGGAHWPVTRAQ
jgi:hypothetical protein